MSLGRAEPRSIASQLVLLFTPAAALLLCGGIGVLYWVVVRHAFAEDRAALEEKIFAVRATLQASGDPRVLQEQLRPFGAGHATYLVRVLDAAGLVVAETPHMARLLPINIFPSATVAAGPRDHDVTGRLFSLGALQTDAHGHSYTIQVAQDRTTDEEFERRFGFLVLLVLIGGIFAAAGIAITVTRRGLRPLSTMTHSLQRVAPEHLHERVPPNEWPRELRPVAIAFDEMLDRLENSFTRLTQFSADLAHEMRTPLANIRGEGEVALTRPRSPNEYQAVIESSVAECARLAAMIDNLLFLARAETAESRVQRRLFDGGKAVEKILGYYEALAAERHLEMSCHGEGTLFADPLLFERALSNLVENAIRFVPDGGKITVTILPEPAATVLTVRDNGAGIAAENLPRVFDRFFRADPSRTSEGTGLGLALVKSIVESHGGAVAIASEVDRGTTVSLRFPVAPSA